MYVTVFLAYFAKTKSQKVHCELRFLVKKKRVRITRKKKQNIFCFSD